MDVPDGALVADLDRRRMLVRLIRDAGKRPVEQNSLYETVRDTFDETACAAGVPSTEEVSASLHLERS